MELDQTTHQCQAYAQATLRVRGSRMLKAGKEVEKLRQGLGCDADARVGHLELDAGIRGANVEMDLTTGRGVLRGIAQKIAEHLHQSGEIAMDCNRTIRALHDEAVLMRLDHGLQRFHGAIDDRTDRHDALAELDGAVRDARDIEKIVDQTREVRRLAIDDIARPDQRFTLQCLILHQIDRVADGGERIAQLMGEDREELVLVPVGFLQRLFDTLAFLVLDPQRPVRFLELAVCLLQMPVQQLELARLLFLQAEVGTFEPLICRREAGIQLLELLTLQIELDQHGHLAAQNVRHDRNRHVVDRTEPVALQSIELTHVHAGDEDDRRTLVARMIVNHRGGLEPIHARHADVQQDDREVALHQQLERFESGARGHEVLSEPAEDGFVGQQPRGLIVDQQNIDPVFALDVAHACGLGIRGAATF